MTTIHTDRLTLRNFTPDDWFDLRQMILQYSASPYAQYDHQWPTSEEDIQGVAQWFAEGDAYLAVCLKPSGTFIGFVCLNPRDDHPGKTLDIGYIFNFDYHGKGYATEACQAAICHAFTQLGAQRVVAGTARENEPSCRLLARLGLERVPESDGVWGLSRERWKAVQ